MKYNYTFCVAFMVMEAGIWKLLTNRSAKQFFFSLNKLFKSNQLSFFFLAVPEPCYWLGYVRLIDVSIQSFLLWLSEKSLIALSNVQQSNWWRIYIFFWSHKCSKMDVVRSTSYIWCLGVRVLFVCFSFGHSNERMTSFAYWLFWFYSFPS